MGAAAAEIYLLLLNSRRKRSDKRAFDVSPKRDNYERRTSRRISLRLSTPRIALSFASANQLSAQIARSRCTLGIPRYRARSELRRAFYCSVSRFFSSTRTLRGRATRNRRGANARNRRNSARRTRRAEPGRKFSQSRNSRRKEEGDEERKEGERRARNSLARRAPKYKVARGGREREGGTANVSVGCIIDLG